MLCSFAKAEMACRSARGRTVPPKVFSSEIRRVGHEWISLDMTTCFLMSSSVRWWPFAGTTPGRTD